MPTRGRDSHDLGPTPRRSQEAESGHAVGRQIRLTPAVRQRRLTHVSANRCAVPRPPTRIAMPTRFLTTVKCSLFLALACLAAATAHAAPENARQGATIYVSKLGDNSDGTSWNKAFHSLQQALHAIPDEQGGHRVIVRPEDCTLMGYKVFGVIVDKDSVDKLRYTCRGKVQAYVQFQQPVPEGMQTLTTWPVDVFQSIAPPARSAN